MLDKKAAAKSLLVVFGAAALIVAFVLFVVCYSGATIHEHPNSLGTVSYVENPNSYRVGLIVAADYVGSMSNHALNVRLKPMDTFMLFSENLLFCGDAATQINGKKNPLALVYETEAHHMVDGVGCHRLVRVIEIPEQGEDQ